MPGVLYVVSTPIGNLEDITLRALRILKEVSIIAAEDTRVTRKLLSHYDIHTPLTSFHEHSRGEKADALVQRLVAGESIAVVSDAGTPLVSDPGADLVTLALERGVSVVPAPGASAALAALVVSGLSAGRFAFDGFPPRPKADRRAFFDGLREERRTIVLYEAPTRVLQTLEELYAALGDRPIAVARELTKLFEEVYRGTLAGAVANLRERRPRGEYVLVVGGAATAPPPALSAAEVDASAALDAALRAELAAGATPRDAVRTIARALGLPRRYVYTRLLELGEG